MNSLELYKKLTQIPFLKLGSVDYLQDLKSALEKVKEREFFEFKTYSAKAGVTVNFGLDVLSIYDFNSDPASAKTSTTILNKGSTFDNWQPCVPSEMALEFPALKRAVDDYLEHPARCRLSRLDADKQVLWHAHSYLHSQPKLTEIILHLPIQSQNVMAQIRGRSGKLYETHFAEGEVWYLNTWHMHSFLNPGPIDRYHVWYNAYLSNGNDESLNPTLHKLFEDALANYSGPLLK